jgi:DNA-binding NarL/FixJ family response regulator
MVAAVERVLAGGAWFPERLRGTALPFTERQVEVLQRARSGLSNKAIARELGVTERTRSVTPSW